MTDKPWIIDTDEELAEFVQDNYDAVIWFTYFTYWSVMPGIECEEFHKIVYQGKVIYKIDHVYQGELKALGFAQGYSKALGLQMLQKSIEL